MFSNRAAITAGHPTPSPPTNDDPAYLLIVESSREGAEALLSMFRNAGVAIRARHATNRSEFQLELSGSEPDLVICATDVSNLGVAEVVQAIKAVGRRIPVIALAERLDRELLTNALAAGACDVVARGCAEHLRHALVRETAIIRERRALEHCTRALEESDSRARFLIDHAPDAITYVHEGMHIYANPKYLQLFGFKSQEEVEGTPIMDMIAAADHAQLKESLRNCSGHGGAAESLQVQGARLDGSGFRALIELSASSFGGEACTQILVREQRDATLGVQPLEAMDPLAGLPTRAQLIAELQRLSEGASQHEPSGALLYLALDGYRAIRDTVGIVRIDSVLASIGELVQDQVAAADRVLRFADNGIAVLTTDRHRAMELADNLRAAVEEHICDVEGKSVTTSCSIGVGLFLGNSPTALDALTHSEAACDMARAAGGNRIHLHEAYGSQHADRDVAAQRIEMVKHALDSDRFRLVYQPIVSLQGNTGDKYEVLLRMLDEHGEEVPPRDFILASEQSGLITEVDRWVIEHAIRTLVERQEAGKETVFFIKLSGPSLADEHLADWIGERLRAVGLPGKDLAFQITESVATTHLKDARDVALRLGKIGCAFALEHFGKGENSFQILKHVPADFLKIDGSLMHNLATKPDHQQKVKRIAEVAHSLGKATIATFVEDASSLAVLWQYGVQYTQGYFLQEPAAMLSYEFSDGAP